MVNKPLKLGATGAFPDGKLTPDDEGQLRAAISSGNGLIRIDFGKPVAWLALDPAGAREVAAHLLDHANRLEKPNA